MTKFMWFYNLVLPLICYVLGVLFGRRSVMIKDSLESQDYASGNDK